jgi:2,3-bisphosphoglycerate-independent phosphoglycerate mutase
MKRYIFLVVDGLADLGKKTPFSEANTPNLDWLAKHGRIGQVRLIPKGEAVASHIANCYLLGYNAKKFYLKRGTLEVIGADLPYMEGQLAFRCNFSTIRDGIIIDRRAGRNNYGLDRIVRSINRNIDVGIDFELHRTYEHRAALIFKRNLSDALNGNDPEEAGQKPRKISALNAKAVGIAKIVQSFIDKTHELIKNHSVNRERIRKRLKPANYILLREPGNRLEAFPVFSRIWGVKNAVAIAENGVMKATCMLAGMQTVTVPEQSYRKDLRFVFDSIESLLAEYQFIYAHIKKIDEAGHDGKFNLKQRMIEQLDRYLDVFQSFDGVLVVTADHITSVQHRKHMPGPVPVLIYGKYVDKFKKFDENTAKKGKQFASGREMLRYVFR